MADIYVRPYGSGNRSSSHVFGILVAGVMALCVIGWWWVQHRSGAEDEPEVVAEEQAPVEESYTAPVEKSVVKSAPVVKPKATPRKEVAKKKATPVRSSASENALMKKFTEAQKLYGSDELVRASRLLEEVANATSDPSLKNNALRVQGRINLKMFFSTSPTPTKKSYIIQPGDSLDRIARKNKTTVELIRKINGINGNLIYPGQRIFMPAKAFELQVYKEARCMDLMMGDIRFKRYAVGLGKYGKTPLGTFYTVVHQEHPDWSPPSGGIVSYGDERNVLGTRWMSIVDETQPDIKGFGIHGTADRTSIGREASNGCIRMLNEEVEEVFLLIPRGTKVVINP